MKALALGNITFSLDLENNLAGSGLPARYPDIVLRLLDLLAELQIKGTFFTVGTLAAEQPELIRRIADSGHEIAYHSRSHVPLEQETAERLLREGRDDKARLEDMAQHEIIGYRAPVWSLVAKTLWVVDTLGELGFEYSSSVLPARNPLYGYPEAPHVPFRWPNGLLELPVPIARIGPIALPLIGGIYLRYVFPALHRFVLNRIPDGTALWTYCHPYDFDPGQKYVRAEGLSTFMSLLLWLNRGGTLQKIERLVSGRAGPPFRERISAGEFEQCLQPLFPMKEGAHKA